MGASEPTDNPPRRKWASGRLLRWGVSIILVVIIAAGIDVAQLQGVAADFQPQFLPLVVGLLLAERVLATYRWNMLLPEDAKGASFGGLLRLSFVSNFLGMFAPGTVGVEAVRVIGLSRMTSNMAMSFTSVLFERLLAIFALALLVVVGVLFLPPGMPRAVTLMGWVGLAGLGLGTAFLMHPPLRRVIDACLAGRLLRPIRTRLAKVYAYLDYYKTRPRLILWALLVAIVFQFSRVMAGVVTAWALGLSFSVLYFFIFMPIIIFASLLPITIAGIGVREAGYVLLFGLIGMSPEAAVAISVTLFGIYIGTIVAPGAVLFVMGRRNEAISAAAADT